MYVGASSHSGPVSPQLEVPRPKNTLHTIPKLELAEARQQFAHYYAQVWLSRHNSSRLLASVSEMSSH